VTLGLAVIAKDEESTLPNLLASIGGAFDQVALLDTGSTDRTLEIFEQWAVTDDGDCRVGHFRWCDDFAAARNAADELLDTDWLCWADADDEIVGADHLRGLLRDVPGRVDDREVRALDFRYEFRDAAGELEPGEEVWRDRLHRTGAGRWSGRLHENKHIDGRLRTDPAVAYWVHTRQADRETSLRRNDAILARWVREEPRNLRPRGMLAARLLERGEHEAGLRHFARYIELSFPEPVSDSERAERRNARWALDTLRAVCDAELPVREFDNYLNCLGTILLTRQPDLWFSSGVFDCAESRRNPEPPARRSRTNLS
jgi:glycosyltransferase involved in cell wall biosynthesis